MSKIYEKRYSKPVNWKVPKNKIGQMKHIYNSNTTPKQNKDNNNTNRKKKHTN